jgi:hypothetical protein
MVTARLEAIPIARPAVTGTGLSAKALTINQNGLMAIVLNAITVTDQNAAMETVLTEGSTNLNSINQNGHMATARTVGRLKDRQEAGPGKTVKKSAAMAHA